MGMRRRDAADESARIRASRRRFLEALALAPFVRTLPARAAAARARVIIGGGGFAGASCALALRKLDPSIDVVVIDPDSRYVTGPMSNAALVAWRSMDSISVSRAGLGRAGVRVVRDCVAAVDADARSVRLASGTTLGYERLVVAPGIRFLWNTPQGYDEAASRRMPHAWIPGEQTELLAAQLRAMADGGVFAISVPGGLIRCPPGPFERATVVAAWLQRHKPRSKVLIFDANNHFPRQAVFEDAWKTRYPGMVEWIASTEGGTVERVDVEKSTLHTNGGAHRVAVANIIPPQAPGQLALDAGLAAGHGWCPVRPDTFESTEVRNVHVLGDACAAGAMPKAASAAHSQAVQCARAITALLAQRDVTTGEFDTACYSFLARDRALSIHGRFAVEGGTIGALPLPSPTVAPSAEQEARLAEQWYRRIVADSLGENPTA
jgi:sulfide dehydrogenase [flavocytochrome c] flavoprotein chain